MSTNRLLSGVHAALITAGLITPVLFAAEFVGGPAWAQASVTADELSAIQVSLSTTLQHATTDQEREAAISDTLRAAIIQYGPGSAATVTSAVMNAAEQADVLDAVIGTALARTAAAMAPANYEAASSIATTVANEGRAAQITTFQSTMASLGYADIASLAGTVPTPAADIDQGGDLTKDDVGPTSGPDAEAGCPDPSCTRFYVLPQTGTTSSLRVGMAQPNRMSFSPRISSPALRRNSEG